jgi:hypothetical protein
MTLKMDPKGCREPFAILLTDDKRVTTTMYYIVPPEAARDQPMWSQTASRPCFMSVTICSTDAKHENVIRFYICDRYT